jgi:hypothetical protein
VVLFKDGKVSGPIKINTKEGEVYGDWIWGDEPYKGYYVAVNGKDEDPGTKQQPLRTVQQALIKLAALYAADASWPDKGTEDEVSGGIIILNEVPVAEQITINNSNSSYPPIILRDDPETPGGKLKAQASDSINGNYLLVIENNARVILGGGLILEGTGNSENNIRGVGVVNNSTFTMNGGEISLNYAIDSSGVHVNNSTFTMNAGVISGNTSTNYASGVSVVDGGTFIMNDGKISGNYAGTNVGGVHVVTGSLFIMKGGEISGNTSTSATGGVYIGAGGSSVPFGQFEKTGGTIYGVDEYDPEDRDSKGNSGNAVWVGYSIPTYRKATTSGPGDILRFNYPLGGEAIGWDVVE